LTGGGVSACPVLGAVGHADVLMNLSHMPWQRNASFTEVVGINLFT
jgi:hypothetical protein